MERCTLTMEKVLTTKIRCTIIMVSNSTTDQLLSSKQRKCVPTLDVIS